MTGAPRIVYKARLDAMPESELDALSRVYAFILQKHRERKKAAPASRPDDDVKESNGYAATENHTR